MKCLKRISKHPSISLVNPCSTLKEVKQIHAQLVVKGSLNHPDFLGQFVATVALSNATNLNYATHVLHHHTDHPTVFALNSIIKAFSKSPTPSKSFHFYTHILHNLSPNSYTFAFFLRTCVQLHAHVTGLTVHGSVIKYGFERHPHVQTKLVVMYAELGCLSSCFSVFDGVVEPNLVSRTAMFHACAKCGDVDLARKMFDEMPLRDHVAWRAMIAAYSQYGRSREALEMLQLMQMEGVKLDEVSMVLVLSACTHMGALDHGRWVHAYVERYKVRMTVTLGTALVDMYAKCGNIHRAMEVFWGMEERNVYTWSSAIGGLAMNGLGEESVNLFHAMKQEGVEPDGVAFVSVLKGCSVVGFVEEGQKHFDSMRNDYGIDPTFEHYGLMVDMYGRAGRLEEALDVINGMPMKPHVGAWGALLHACREYKNRELGELAMRKIVELEDKKASAYVLLSNIYADYKNWERVSSLRQTMKAKGVKNIPGCSVIEVDGQVHKFMVGDNSHPRYGEIELKLEEISRCLRLAGNVANTNPVLFDID